MSVDSLKHSAIHTPDISTASMEGVGDLGKNISS
jgi:hypothetical protein